MFSLCIAGCASASLFSSRPKEDSLETQEARGVVAKWRGIVAKAGSDGNKVTAPEKTIQTDRSVVLEALKSGVRDDDLDRSLKQIRILLDLAEVRQAVKSSQSAMKRFGSYFSDEQRRKKGNQVFGQRYRQLGSLLTAFNKLLKRYPELKTNTPELLVGMVDTLSQGWAVLKELERYRECFKTPDKAQCTRLAQKGGRQSRWYNEDEDDEGYGSDFDEYDTDQSFY